MTPVERLARAIALIVIATAVLDPACTRDAPGRAEVSLIVDDTVTAPADVEAVRQRLAARLADVAVVRESVGPETLEVVVIGERLPPGLQVPERARVSAIATDARADLVTISALRARDTVRLGTRQPVFVALQRRGQRLQRTLVTLRAGDLVVARHAHTWTAGQSSAEMRFEWVPWASGLEALTAEAVSGAAVARDGTPERAAGDTTDVAAGVAANTVRDSADAAVLVRDEPIDVLVLEGRPSWATAFARRALEDDPTMRIASRTRISRSVMLSATPDAPSAVALTEALARSTEIVVAGSTDALDAADRAWLDHFMRARGGAVVVLPDGAAGFSALRAWMPASARDRVERQAQRFHLGDTTDLAWAGREWIEMTSPSPATQVLARTTDPPLRAAIVAHPVGRGRLVVALVADAWRFRLADDVAHDAAWRALVARLADDVVGPVSIDVTPGIVRPGGALSIAVTWAASQASPRGATAVSTLPTAAGLVGEDRQSAGEPSAVGADSGTPVRVELARGSEVRLVAAWPTSTPDVFRAVTPAPIGEGLVRVRAIVGGTTVDRPIMVRAAARPVPAPAPPPAVLARAHGGEVVPAGDSDAFAERLRARVGQATPRLPVTTHPMRSPWWALPIVGLLGAEWWLRRRRGGR